jgi:hypothetical protein
MAGLIKDIYEVFVGQGNSSCKPFLSSKNIGKGDLEAILYDLSKINDDDFILQSKRLTFVFPYNNAKKWLLEIKNVLLMNSSKMGRMLYPGLCTFLKGDEVKFFCKIFIKTKCVNDFTQENLNEIGVKILKKYIIIPSKFCSLDISSKKNDEISIKIGRYESPSVSGDGFWISFGLQCRLKKACIPRHLNYFSKIRMYRIGMYGRYIPERNELFLLLRHLFEYGNLLVEFPEYIERFFPRRILTKSTSNNYDIKYYIKRNTLEYRRILNLFNCSINVSTADNKEYHFEEIVKHRNFGLGKIIRCYNEKGSKRIDVLFFEGFIVRTLVLQYAKKCFEFYQEKYSNQIFYEKVYILSDSPIYENCIFEDGVMIMGNASPLFSSCRFEEIEQPSVFISEEAIGYFCNCKMYVVESIAIIRVQDKAQGYFFSSSIGYSRADGVWIMDEASVKFENCCFEQFWDDGSGMPEGPIYLDAKEGKKIVFFNCSFFATEENRMCFCIRGKGPAVFENCNLFYPTHAYLFDEKESLSYLFDEEEFHRHKFYNCRFNRTFQVIFPNMENCFFEPEATKEKFMKGGCDLDI